MFSTREKNDLSDSILVPGKARSRSTDITGSSWYLVPEDVPCACGDDTAEDVSGAGAIFQDVTRSPLSVDEELLQI